MNYEAMVQEGLRDVVKKILLDVGKNGLVGNHHLYITYRTDFPGVTLPSYLKERHPHDITIVMQYQFWDLKIEEDYFQITLSFSESHETLTIPYKAISGVVDPSVKFGLQLNPVMGGDEVFVGDENLTDVAPNTTDMTELPTEKSDAPDSSNVVTLDAFRNKKK